MPLTRLVLKNMQTLLAPKSNKVIFCDAWNNVEIGSLFDALCIDDGAMHVMVDCTQESISTIQEQIVPYLMQLPNRLTPIDTKRQWPFPMSGIWRIRYKQGTINLCFGRSDSALENQLVAEIDIFILSQKDKYRYSHLFKMAAQKTCVIAIEPIQSKIDEALSYRTYQFTKKVHDDYLCWDAVSKRQSTKPSYEVSQGVAIVGAGLAGSAIAHAFAQRGVKVSLIDTDSASQSKNVGHIGAALTPVLTVDDSHKSRLSRAGIFSAFTHWQHCSSKALISASGTFEVPRKKGVGKDLQAMVQEGHFPPQWVQWLGISEAQKLSGIKLEQEGAFFPFGQIMSPWHLTQELSQHRNIHYIQETISLIQKEGDDWLLFNKNNKLVLSSKILVLAASYQSSEILKNSGLIHKKTKNNEAILLSKLDQMQILGGQVMHVDAAALTQGGPACTVGAEGYCVPLDGTTYVMGGTYEHGNPKPLITKEAQQLIVNKMQDNIKAQLIDFSTIQSGWSGARAVLSDRMPVIGPWDTNSGLFLACGYASHGLTWASLAAELFTSILFSEPLALEKELLKAIAPR